MQAKKRGASPLRPEILKRIIIYGALTLLLGSAQCSFFPMLRICPSTPDLIMGMLLAITLLDSEKSAAAVAIGAGFFIDAVGGGAIAFSPIVYLLFVLVISLFSQKMLPRFASFAILTIPMIAYRALATVVCAAISDGAFAPMSVIAQKLMWEALCTAVFCLPLYPALKLASTPLETHGKFSF